MMIIWKIHLVALEMYMNGEVEISQYLEKKVNWKERVYASISKLSSQTYAVSVYGLYPLLSVYGNYI